MTDPRAPNCRQFQLDGNLVTGVEQALRNINTRTETERK